MPAFKDEHVLIIAPGSQTTQAQLGLPETFTPPRWRFPTRMFPGSKEGEWEPIKIRSRTTLNTAISKSGTDGTANGTSGNRATKVEADVVMSDAPVESTKQDPSTIQSDTAPSNSESLTTTENHYEDDPLDVTGAVYPMVGGRVENWPCFFAVLSHIYKFVSPPFHMPVIVIAQPCWTARDKEWITQYFFENWKIPALCVMDAAVAAVYAFGISSATIVDIGADKADVSAVVDFVVNDIGRGAGLEGCGGNAMTKRLQEALKKNGHGEVSWEMAEQLKRSPVCEILPPGVPLPTTTNQTASAPMNPAAAASTGALDSGVSAKDSDGQRPGDAPRGPGMGTDVGEEGGEDDDDEGVLDVAAIVARDNAAELLAKREKEKAERVASKKGATAAEQRQVRLRNAERDRASFTFVEYVSPEIAQNGNRKRKREVEVGVERLMSGTAPEGESDGVLDKVAAAVHSTIMGVPDITARAGLWENLIVLGNGSRVRGFTNALLGTINSKFTLSPSTATIFTSELPSNFTTPVPTNGTNTPIPGQSSHPHPSSHGVNPLLVAATKNMMQPGNSSQHLGIPGQSSTPMSGMDPAGHQSYRGHTQTPTSVKTVKTPEYFPDWKDPSAVGMEEAAFLGAQIAAKVIFIVDGGLSKGFLTRPDYNELGPEGIHTCAM